MKMRTIGFAGTAKNTGKTTTALKVLEQSSAAGFQNALTSIGLDGEQKDQVTGLPKPRYFLQKGAVAVTADECLGYTSAAFEILFETPLQTSLGQVMIVRITKPGNIALAGPNRQSDLEWVLQKLQQMGIDLTIIDGALNRLVPMICADGLILSTGAAFEEDIPSLTHHAAALLDLFTPSRFPLETPFQNKISLLSRNETLTQLDRGSLLNSTDIQKIIELSDGRVDTLVIPGACYPSLIADLLASEKGKKFKHIVFGNPLKLIASGSPLQWRAVFEAASENSTILQYLETLPVMLMTVNPFFPRYDPRTFSYQPAMIDAPALLASMRSKLPSLPVIDLMQPPVPDLLPLLKMNS
jgi:hypothetical protein